MAGIQIETRLRPCYISIKKGKKEKALFHGWNFVSWNFVSNVVEPSLMIGGHPGGVIAYSTGIVELEDGRVIEVMPTSITFCKGIFNDYCWDEKGE